MQRVLILLANVVATATPHLLNGAEASSSVGQIPNDRSVDIASFGKVTPWADAGESGLAVQWNERRDVYAVRVRYKEAASAPKADGQRIEYWFSKWPNEGTGGWRFLDDPWNGKWLTARTDIRQDGATFTCRFAPLTKKENPEAESVDFPYRRCLKVRLVVRSPSLPAIESLEVYGNSEWKHADLTVEWGCLAKTAEAWDGSVEAVNAQVVSVSPVTSGTAMTGTTSWKSQVNGRPESITLQVRYADNADRLNNDRGAVTVRTRARSFSFFVDDVIREQGLFIRDIGAFVSADGTRYADWKGPATPHWEKTIMQRVAGMPEQTMARAMAAMVPKPPRYVPLGVPAGRQEIYVGPNGDFAMHAQSCRTEAADTQRRGWNAGILHYRLTTGPQGTPAPTDDRQVRRTLEDGHLPLIKTQWQTDGVDYTQSAIVTTLLGDVGDHAARTGAEPVVYLARIDITNGNPQPREAVLWLGVTPHRSYHAEPNGLLVLDKLPETKTTQDVVPVLGQIVAGIGGQFAIVAPAKAQPPPAVNGPDQQPDGQAHQLLRYSVRLEHGQTHSLYLKAPYVQCLDRKELARFESMDFSTEAPGVLSFWRNTLAVGMQIDVPDRSLNDFYRANLWHVLISTDKDPATGLYMAPAATIGYHVFANETCMIARSLEMRGFHDEAARYLQPFFHYQGDKPLPGNFTDQDGILYSAGDYTHIPYNMHHGFVLWAAAEHYKWTQDRAWLDARVPGILKACDWIVHQRRTTMKDIDGKRPLEYGLVPAGQLEDVTEFQYWFATNAYFYLGLRTAADVLADIHHARAADLQRDADAYKTDILAAAHEMLARTPVVRLLDGTYVPYLPSRLHVRTHLEEGWIREALYCSLHLLDTGIFDPQQQEVEWILQDLEDNIFVRPESGYDVSPLEDKWFDWGGFTMQPDLLDNGIACLRRGEVPNFLRAFFNTFAASIYPDVMCFAEWVPERGQGGGPLYKAPDECKFVQWLRQMLVREEGDRLYLASGVPVAWFEDGKTVAVNKARTFFGNLDFQIRSEIGRGRIHATVAAPRLRPPAKILIRFIHPEVRPISAVTLNGQPWKSWDPRTGVVELPGTLSEAAIEVHYSKEKDHP